MFVQSSTCGASIRTRFEPEAPSELNTRLTGTVAVEGISGNMRTVFRVKRRLDEKQLTGLQIAKRQRLESDVPVILTYAGTTPGNDPETVLSVIRCHQEGGNAVSTEESSLERKMNYDDAPAGNPKEDQDTASFTLTDVDELFRIYDAYQENITKSDGTKERADLKTGTGGAKGAASEFVYDIYYLRDCPSSGRNTTTVDFSEENFTLEQWSPGNGELVDDQEEVTEAYEDEDSNAEDNPHNDYPDEEDWYSDNGTEIPPVLEDDDYYSYESRNHLSSLEQQMRDLNFFGNEDSE